MNTPASVELLEARIAPAFVIAANGLSATYTDIDGDTRDVSIREV